MVIIVLTLDENDEIINEEEINARDSIYYFNKRDGMGNRYHITTTDGSQQFKKKSKSMVDFQKEPVVELGSEDHSNVS